MDPEAKQQWMDRFSDFLDRVDQPLSNPTAEAPDLFSLLAEQAALKNEVKIESRQVKTALEEFRGLFDTLRQANARLDADLSQQRQREGDVRQSAEQELLVELLDLRDRLQAAANQSKRYQPRWLARRGGAGVFVDGIAKGLAMNLGRLDEILERRGVQALETIGQRFDPQTMRATETKQLAGTGNGIVIKESRKGFTRHGKLLRLAEVVVNKTEHQV